MNYASDAIPPKLAKAIAQAEADQRAARANRETYRALVTPGPERWHVTAECPMIEGHVEKVETAARRIDEVADEAAKALIDFDVTCRSARPSYGFDVAVEMANPYKPIPGTPNAIVVDIDGTLALHNNRGPFDFDQVETDDLCEGVAQFVNLMYAGFSEVVLLSGRQSEFRPHTERWLEKHCIGFTELHMRAVGDRRSDCLVKAELFDKHVRDRFTVTHVLDDRNRVVYLWRKLGLPCWQVADGDF